MNEIKDYFLIGDLHTAALVSKTGSIDWLCLPNFDSPSVFAKILDEDAGSFCIDQKNFEASSEYLDESAIVETRLKNSESEISVKSFMLPHAEEKCRNHFLVRKIEGISGNGTVIFTLNPKPDYGKSELNFTIENSKLSAVWNGGQLVVNLPKNAGVKKENGISIKIAVKQGEASELVVEYFEGDGECGTGKRDLEEETLSFWKNWLTKAKFHDFCKEEQARSAIALKLMQYYPTGALVAAPTTSLPSEIGGVRNWDYRFTWIRDATFTLYAFNILQLHEEATRFFQYIKTIADKRPEDDFDVNLIYTIHGGKAPDERSLNYLSGYKNSSPVRIGNGASTQFQLDTYGALIDAYYFMLKKMPDELGADKELLINLAEKIKSRWMEKDRGIWEVRKDKYHFTYSKVMAWVGIDRILKIADILELGEEKIEEYTKLRAEIKDWIWKNCYDEEKETFVQYPGAGYQDATNFLFVLLHFLDKRDPLTKKILDNTRKALAHNKIFVYRYIADDGIEGEDNAFLLCTFWMISAYAILEDVDTATDLFETFEEYLNSNGLISEQMDSETGEYLGNYPQAFSHLGFVMSAFYLDKYKSRKNSDS